MNPNDARQCFELALDLPADRRERFLEEYCGDDTELLAEVRSLIDADRAGDQFLELSSALTGHRFLGDNYVLFRALLHSMKNDSQDARGRAPTG